MARPKKVKEVVDQDVSTAKIAELQPEETTEALVAPEFQAVLSSPQRQDYPRELLGDLIRQYGDNQGYIYWGHIFEDTHTHGNHPFPAGTYIRTSLVRKEEVIDGVRYIHTLNTVYKVA